jgi:UDP-2,4-diacetamido-2,4,6-trideoxy-beta-L-altropyranose hydrolase
MSRVVFRVDASEQMGGGHVSRCATLARGLIDLGAEVTFLCRLLPGHFCDWLEVGGFTVIRIQQKAHGLSGDVKETKEALIGLGKIDWLIVEHYGLDVNWESAMRSVATQIMVIDDKANRAHDCDILLDQNYIDDAETRYTDLVPINCRKILGPRYALLSKNFYELRQRLRVRDGKIRRLLICFGATDPTGHTIKALRAVVESALEFEHIDVVTSPQNPLADELMVVCSTMFNTYFHCPAIDLPHLIEAADLAIGAGGIMNWERACLALPTIAFGVVDNQKAILAALIRDGFVLGQSSIDGFDKESMAAWLFVASRNPELLRGIAIRSASLVDGRGVERVIEHIIPAIFTFRPATLADSNSLFEWRNSPVVSDASVSGCLQDFLGHENWLKAVLKDENKILLLIEKDNKKIGVVRFDCTDDEAIISIYRVPGIGNARGLIRQSTNWLQQNRVGIKRIVANILFSNASSMEAFRSAGYRDSTHRLYIDLKV